MQVTLSGLSRTAAITALAIETAFALYVGIIAMMVGGMSYAVDAKDSTDLTVTLVMIVSITTVVTTVGAAAMWLLGRPRHDRWARGVLHAVIAIHAVGGVAALLGSRLWGVALVLVACILAAATRAVGNSPQHA